jgi:hypothetical protein
VNTFWHLVISVSSISICNHVCVITSTFTPGSKPTSWEANDPHRGQEISPCSLLCLHPPATCPYREPQGLSPFPSTTVIEKRPDQWRRIAHEAKAHVGCSAKWWWWWRLLKMDFIVSISPTPRSSKWSPTYRRESRKSRRKLSVLLVCCVNCILK